MLERVGVAPRAVEREHELGAQALAQRLLPGQRLELAHELGMAAEREVGVDPSLQAGQAELLQAGDLGLGEGLVAEVGEGLATPERQRFGAGRPLLRPRLPRAMSRRAPSKSRSNSSRSHSSGATRSRYPAGWVSRRSSPPRALRRRDTDTCNAFAPDAPPLQALRSTCPPRLARSHARAGRRAEPADAARRAQPSDPRRPPRAAPEHGTPPVPSARARRRWWRLFSLPFEEKP